jgi:phosphatidylserine decarboxylase
MAREGLYFSLPFAMISLVFILMFRRYPSLILLVLFAVFFILGCLVSLFFRDPERKIPNGEELILSPADGKIKSIRTIDGRTVITIFLSVFNVHINRAPVAGTIKRADYKPGKFLAAFREDASDINERNEIEIENSRGTVVVHQIAGVIARRVVCRVKEGQAVKSGDRFGLIRFGSRVDLFFPESVSVQVAVGKKVKGGLTVMGKWQ